MTTQDLQKLVWETHRFMPRMLKVRLAIRLQGSYDLVQEASTLLGRQEVPLFDVAASTIEADYIILRDSANQEFAKVYIGDSTKHFNTIIFPEGQTVTGHDMCGIKGEPLIGGGYYESCKCNLCFAARLLKASTKDRPHLVRNIGSVLTVPSISQCATRSHTDRVAEALRSADIRTEPTTMTQNIIGYYNQDDNEYREIQGSD